MLVAGAAVMFGTNSYISRSAGEVGLGALPLVSWRGAIGTVAMLALTQLFAVRGARAGAAPATWLPAGSGRRLLIACLLGAIVNVCMFEAFARTTIATALICFYTFPALVTLAAVRFYGERLNAVRGGALLLSGVGLVLVVLSPALGSGAVSLDPIGVGLAIVAAVCQASFLLIAGRGFGALPPVRVAAYLIFATGAVAVALTLAAGDLAGLSLPLGAPATWLWILLGGVIGAAIPTTMFLTGIGLIGPSRVAILMTIEPLVGVAIAALLLGERPTLLQVVGGVAVLAAAVILQVVPSKGPVAPEAEVAPLV